MQPDFLGNPFSASNSTEQHRAEGRISVGVAVLTVSDTRTREDDGSGRLIREHLGFRGHEILGYEIVKDEEVAIRETLCGWLSDTQVQAIIINGGTGIAGRDVTIPVVQSLIEKEMPGFGEIFRMLSYQEVGAASMLSRATAGVSNGTLIFALPGSTNAVRLALEKLIGPELGHIVYEITKQQ
ncbi:MAG: MogA/MoaB family molybdenum cofactor biosynthesis protein [Thermomicrobiales bacterium]|nr:MogA/MoaB family molybdenum cofactor biosynthesis protein [Thermomicrobiales bacterium]MCO5224447.1 MogA/MoaB family molybdenum cofactor biosynthesis protein [Thermomicrobiales bacterium]